MAWPCDVVESLKPVGRPRENRWLCLCPGHDDSRPSLQVDLVPTRDGRGEALLLLCRAGCRAEEIARAAGLEMKDLFLRHAHGWDAPPRARAKLVRCYDYVSETGELLWQKLRYEPKEFRQRRPDGQGGWIWDLEGVRRVLYRLPELLASAGPVLLCEGEKDADAGIEAGFAATTATEGAGSGWDSPAYPSLLAGRDCVIVPDEDKAGLLHAQRVAGALMLYGRPRSVRILRLPFAPGSGGKDLSDWLAKAGRKAGRAKLAALVEALPAWRMEEVSREGA